MKKVGVFGAGLVGSFIAKRLADEGYSVDAYDIKFPFGMMVENDREVGELRWHSESVVQNTKLAVEFDLVINAMPGSLGLITLGQAIHTGTDVVDISFMPEDPVEEFNKLAEATGSTVVTDFGFAPGLCHMFVMRDQLEMRGVQSCEIYVGGLQLDRNSKYKAVFSPRDVLEEYTRPARYRLDGRILEEAPFEVPYGYFDYGAFISDGLRSLLRTTNIPTLVEYTLRELPHLKQMKSLKDMGFFRPEFLETTAQVLADDWKFDPRKDKDFSLLHVTSWDDEKKVVHAVYDEYDEENKVHSMARTTGLPAVAMAMEILEGRYKSPGVKPPELIAVDLAVYERIGEYLVDNGIKITKEVEYFNEPNRI